MDSNKIHLIIVFLIILSTALSGCGGGGGGGGGVDISNPPASTTPAPTTSPTPAPTTPPPGTSPTTSPTTPQHDFNVCYFTIALISGCFGGAPGFYELREHVRQLFDDGTRSDTDKVTLVVTDTGTRVAHNMQIGDIANLHNDGVGGTIVLSSDPLAGGGTSNDLRLGNLGTPDIISRSATSCIGQYAECFDPTLFDEPDEPILVLSAGNDGAATALHFMLVINSPLFSTVTLADDLNSGHYLYVYGLNEQGDAIHLGSSTCHDLIKDYCIGAPMIAVAGGGTISTDGVYTGNIPRMGTSFATPIVAVALKLLKEADPSVENAKLIQIACRTATDLGIDGNDARYGCGALNLVALFDEFGNFVGIARIPGLRSDPFNTASITPKVNYLPRSFLLADNSQKQKFSFAQDAENDSVILCKLYFCLAYSNQSKDLQQGFVWNSDKLFAGVFLEKSDHFFGGTGTARSALGKTRYLKSSVGFNSDISSYDVFVRFDIAKGKSEGGERISSLAGIHNELAMQIGKRIDNQSNLSFTVSSSDFAGDAKISGTKHSLKSSDIAVGIQYSIDF